MTYLMASTLMAACASNAYQLSDEGRKEVRLQVKRGVYLSYPLLKVGYNIIRPYKYLEMTTKERFLFLKK